MSDAWRHTRVQIISDKHEACSSVFHLPENLRLTAIVYRIPTGLTESKFLLLPFRPFNSFRIAAGQTCHDSTKKTWKTRVRSNEISVNITTGLLSGSDNRHQPVIVSYDVLFSPQITLYPLTKPVLYYHRISFMQSRLVFFEKNLVISCNCIPKVHFSCLLDFQDSFCTELS